MPLLVVQPLYKWIGQNPLWSKILIQWYSFCQKHNQPIFRKPLDPSSTSHQVCWRSQIPVVCALLFKKNHLKIFPELVWLRFRILCLLKNHTSIGFWHFSGDGCWEKDEVLLWKKEPKPKNHVNKCFILFHQILQTFVVVGEHQIVFLFIYAWTISHLTKLFQFHGGSFFHWVFLWLGFTLNHVTTTPSHSLVKCL